MMPVNRDLLMGAVIFFICVGVIFVAITGNTGENYSVKCNKDICGSNFSEQNYDFNQCVHIKTSVIHSVKTSLSHNYLTDSDGLTYDWDGGLSEYYDYEYHNVTFVYNSCDKVRGYNQFIGVLQDNSCCGEWND